MSQHATSSLHAAVPLIPCARTANECGLVQSGLVWSLAGNCRKSCDLCVRPGLGHMAQQVRLKADAVAVEDGGWHQIS